MSSLCAPKITIMDFMTTGGQHFFDMWWTIGANPLVWYHSVEIQNMISWLVQQVSQVKKVWHFLVSPFP